MLARVDRFQAEVQLSDGARVVAHCVNTGRMEGLTKPGRRVWLSHSTSPTRKLPYTWEMVELEAALGDSDAARLLVGTNTSLPNRIAERLLAERLLPGLSDWTSFRREARLSEHSRSDFLLETSDGQHFVEVKNCHLVYPDGGAYFPDSRSERGTKHLVELADHVAAGGRASVLFVVQRRDARVVLPSDVHDPDFAHAARAAGTAGVRFLAVCMEPTLEGLHLRGMLPVDLRPYDLQQPDAWRRALQAEAPAWVRGTTRRRAQGDDEAASSGR